MPGARGAQQLGLPAFECEVAAAQRKVAAGFCFVQRVAAGRLQPLEETRHRLQAGSDDVAHVEHKVIVRVAVVEIPEQVGIERQALVGRRDRRDLVEREQVAEGQVAELHVLAPVRAQTGKGTPGWQRAQPLDEGCGAFILVDGPRGTVEEDVVQAIKAVALDQCRQHQQQREQDEDRRLPPGLPASAELPEPSGPDRDQQQRGHVHAANEAVHDQALVHRQQVEQRTPGDAPEIKQQPGHEQCAGQHRLPGAGQRRCQQARGHQRRHDRQAAMVEQVAACQPLQDRLRAEGVVLPALQVGRGAEVDLREDEGQPEVAGDQSRQRPDQREAQAALTRIAARQAHGEQDGGADRHHVGIDQVRQDQCREGKDCWHAVLAALQVIAQQGQADEGQVHGPDLGVHAEAAPDVAVVLEAVAEVACKEGRQRRRRDRTCVRKVQLAQGPEHRQRETDEQQVAHEVEDGNQADVPEQQPLHQDDAQVRQVLVIEKLGKTELQHRRPEVERVGATGQGAVGALHQQEMEGVVVQVGDGSQLRQQRHGAEQQRQQQRQPGQQAWRVRLRPRRFHRRVLVAASKSFSKCIFS